MRKSSPVVARTAPSQCPRGRRVGARCLRRGLRGGTIPGASGAAKAGDTILGAGASFPYPLYSEWGTDYNGLTGVKLNYQSIGSGGGISAIKAKTVDFGASDAPLEPAELEAAGLIQFPMSSAASCLVVNLDGVENGRAQAHPERSPTSSSARSRMERPRDRRRRTPRQAARQQDQRRAPLRRLGHDLDLHQLPRGRGRRRLDAGRRQGDRLAGRRRRQGQRGRGRQRAAAERLDRLRRVRLRQADRHAPPRS